MAGTEGNWETVLALPAPISQIPPAKALRGTVIATSLGMAREHGFEAKYFDHLPPEHHAAVRELQPASWVPMEIVIAHYRAMTHVFPSAEQQIENGRISSERTQNAYIRTVVRALQATGQVTPLTAMKRLPAVFARMLQGGGAGAVYSVGPKDGRIELVNYPLLEVPYVRNGWQGMFESGLSLTARRVHVKQDPKFRGVHNTAYLVSWV